MEECQPSVSKPTAKFKCILVGDNGVGKSTFIQRHLTGDFDHKYYASPGVWVHPITINNIEFTVWDVGTGGSKFGTLRDAYYINGHCAILMFDVTSKETYKSIPKWYKDIKGVCGDIPMVLLGNKVDAENRKVNFKYIVFHKKRGIEYYDISVKDNYNLDKPFLYLSQKLSGQPNMEGAPDKTPLSNSLTPQLSEEPNMELAASNMSPKTPEPPLSQKLLSDQPNMELATSNIPHDTSEALQLKGYNTRSKQKLKEVKYTPVTVDRENP